MSNRTYLGIVQLNLDLQNILPILNISIPVNFLYRCWTYVKKILYFILVI